MKNKLLLIFALALCLSACKGGDSSSAPETESSVAPAVTEASDSKSDTWSKGDAVPGFDDPDGALDWNTDPSDESSAPAQTASHAESKTDNTAPGTSENNTAGNNTGSSGNSTDKPSSGNSGSDNSSGSGNSDSSRPEAVTKKPSDSSSGSDTGTTKTTKRTSASSSSADSSSNTSSEDMSVVSFPDDPIVSEPSSDSSRQDSSNVLGDEGVHWL